MESYVGIVRSNTRLTRAWNRLDILYEETEKLFKSSKATRELCELRNMINVGYLITRQAMVHGTFQRVSGLVGTLSSGVSFSA